MLQCVAVCCSVLQCVAVWPHILWIYALFKCRTPHSSVTSSRERICPQNLFARENLSTEWWWFSLAGECARENLSTEWHHSVDRFSLAHWTDSLPRERMSPQNLFTDAYKMRICWQIHVMCVICICAIGSWSDTPPTLLYGVATLSRLLQIIGRFCKRALQKRPIFSRETCNFKEATNRSHPIASARERVCEFK